MTRNLSRDYQTRLEICEAEKKDLQDEVKFMKESIKAKNEEIGSLKSKLRSSATELADLEQFLMCQVSALTARLTKPVQEVFHPTSHHPIISSNPADQNANQEILISNSVLSQATQPTDGAHLAPMVYVAEVPAPQPTLPSSSTQPISARSPRGILSDAELPPVKKLLFECGKCKSKHCTAVKLNNHMYTMHGNSSSSEDPFTPIANAVKNKARKLRNKNKKIKLEPEPSNPKLLSPPMKAPKTQVTCPGCGKQMRRDSLSKHTKKSCKGSREDIRDDGAGMIPNVDLTDQSEDEISFKIRSTYKSEVNGENLLVKMKVKPSITIGKVKDKFSRRLAVSMDRLVMRCNGQLLENEGLVRNLEKQTVWLSVVEVKDEENN